MKYYSLYDPVNEEWSELIPAKSVESLVLQVAQSRLDGYTEDQLSGFQLRLIVLTRYNHNNDLIVLSAADDGWLAQYDDFGLKVVTKRKLLQKAQGHSLDEVQIE